MVLAKLPMLPEHAISRLPGYMAHFFLGRIAALQKESWDIVAEAEYAYFQGWADALEREPELFRRLVSEVDWQANRVLDNHKKARVFFAAEADARGTTVHHMLFGFPEGFDEWFDPGDAGGDRNAPAERTLLLKFLLKDADPRVVEGLYNFPVGSEPIKPGGYLKPHHFRLVRAAQKRELVASSENVLRGFCQAVTGLRYFDMYVQGGVSVAALRQLTGDKETIIVDAAVLGVDVVYAARAVVSGVTDLSLIVRGSKDGLPVEYLGAV